MRFHDPLDDLFGNRGQLRLLRILSRAGDRGLTGRELARLCGASSSQTIAALRELEESGLVVREIVGRAHLWRITEEHVLTPVVRALFRAEAEAFTALRTDLERVLRKLPVRRAVLFGSVARGDERRTSDVDVLVEVKSHSAKEQVEEALSALSIDFTKKFGNPLSTLVLDESHLRGPPNPSLMVSLRREGVELETNS